MLINESLFADAGFAPPSKDIAYAAQANDIEAGVRLWREGSTLKVLFLGILKGGKKASYEVMPIPPLRFYTLYAFDGDSPSIGMESGILCEGTPQYGAPSLGWKAFLPGAKEAIAIVDGRKTPLWKFKAKTKSEDALPITPVMEIGGSAGAELLRSETAVSGFKSMNIAGESIEMIVLRQET
jgi:hypothetical protein